MTWIKSSSDEKRSTANKRNNKQTKEQKKRQTNMRTNGKKLMNQTLFKTKNLAAQNTEFQPPGEVL